METRSVSAIGVLVTPLGRYWILKAIGKKSYVASPMENMTAIERSTFPFSRIVRPHCSFIEEWLPKPVEITVERLEE